MLSDGGFDPDSWGPQQWHMMHLAAASFPSVPTHADRIGFYKYFQSLQYILPCGGCRAHYAALITRGNLKLVPAIFKDRSTLFSWTVHVHNAVNAATGKPVNGDVRAWYAAYERLRVK
jgi:FAD-linked sulfhydryl oxidase